MAHESARCIKAIFKNGITRIVRPLHMFSKSLCVAELFDIYITIVTHAIYNALQTALGIIKTTKKLIVDCLSDSAVHVFSGERIQDAGKPQKI